MLRTTGVETMDERAARWEEAINTVGRRETRSGEAVWKLDRVGKHSRGESAYSRAMESEKVKGNYYVEEMDREGGVRMKKVNHWNLQLTIKDYQDEGKEMLKRSRSMRKLRSINMIENQPGEDIMDRREDQELDMEVGNSKKEMETVDLTGSAYGSGQDTDMEGGGKSR